MVYATLSPNNLFSFTCPIFAVDTKMSSCVALRDAVWMGKQVEVRRGCQACMTANKCPAAAVVRDMAFSRSGEADEYASATPVLGKLGIKPLERIANTVVTDSTLNAYNVPLAERNLIESSRERIFKQLQTAPAQGRKRSISYDIEPIPKSTGKGTVKRRSIAPENINSAAQTGDLSAAISKE